MRTWTLWQNATDTRQDEMGLQVDQREGVHAPQLSEDSCLQVVELEPVLNLLERLDRDVKMVHDAKARQVLADMERLLQAHGRLGGSSLTDRDMQTRAKRRSE